MSKISIITNTDVLKAQVLETHRVDDASVVGTLRSSGDGAFIKIHSVEQAQLFVRSDISKPIVLCYDSNFTGEPETFDKPHIVCLRFSGQGDSVRFLRKKDLTSIQQHFTNVTASYPSEASAVFSLALWLACFRCRNAMRLNRFSLYWQNSLSKHEHAYTFSDLFSRLRGGKTRGDYLKAGGLVEDLVLLSPPRVVMLPEEEKSGMENKQMEKVKTVLSKQATPRSGYTIPAALFTSKAAESEQELLAEYLESNPYSVAIIVGATDKAVVRFLGLERTALLDGADMLSEEGIQTKLSDFLHIHLFAPQRVVSPEIIDPEYQKELRSELRSLLLQATPYQSRGAVEMDTLRISMKAFHDALEISAQAEQGAAAFGTTQVFGREQSLAPFPSNSTTSTILPPVQDKLGVSVYPPWSVFGANVSRKASVEPQALNTASSPLVVQVKGIPEFFRSDIVRAIEAVPATPHTAFTPESRQVLVSKEVWRNHSLMKRYLERQVFESYEHMQKNSIITTSHFQTVLPMVRNTELHTYREHVVQLANGGVNDGTSRALFRVVASGFYDRARIAACLSGAYYSQLQSGGPGTAGTSVWNQSANRLTELGSVDKATPENISTHALLDNHRSSSESFLQNFTHPLERHARLMELLGERNNNVNNKPVAYVSALSASLSDNNVEH